MAWDTSTRRSSLPPNWSTIRRRILRRDKYECQMLVDGWPCSDYANEVDHVLPSGPDSDDNLQSLCRRHHGAKSAREGNVARAKKRQEISRRLVKPSAASKHPGML